jgi:Sec-independent protein translocase protein TatA
MKLPGTGEILLILLLCVVVFTASKVNSMGDALGALFGRKRAPKTDDRISIRPVTPPEDTSGSSKPG